MKNLLTFGLLLLGFAVVAQPGMPNNPTPIDGLTGLLVVGGAIIGFRNRNKIR
ncbi:hypothetical protein [Schleiferia thermophila]|jgi:hypothetical protein|uniref:Uncharacterized protein n=1 Tax=Schleiferia thermophila TaxID=884107 RepID=A0A369A7L7_9FLAO|nr:hypothetical protein [Schleiferia thermophila]KFD38209.1 hypothetical protein AT05_11350 [Schleiferia thermophila str. Yellowstone]RCX05143.1 hypothetical protein DES35_101426 [Schleiferia thermophila]